MLIEIRKPKSLLCLIAIALSFQLSAQDPLNVKPFERYWTKPRLAPKIGAGVQETWFIEAGVQWHKIYVHPLSLASAGPYFAMDGMLRDESPIIGPKLGYEVTAGLLGIAADMTMYTDFDRGESLVVTPKIGISVLGFVDLFYGRNIGVSHFQYGEVDKSRFSLVFNLNRDYFNLRDAPKKP